VRALRLLQYDDIVQRHGQLALSEVNVQMVLLVELQWGIRVSPGGRGSFAVAEPGVEPQGIGIRLNHYEWVSVIVPTAALQKAAPSRTGPLGDGKIEFKVHGVQKVDEANKVIPLDLDWTRSTQITRTRTRSHVIFRIGDDYVGYGRSGCIPIIREHPAWHLRLNRVRALRLLQYDDIVQRHGQLALSEVDLQMVLLAELHGDSRVSPGGRGTSAVAEPGIEPLGTGILVHHYEWVSVIPPAAALKEATPSRTGPLGDGKIQFKVHLVRNVDGADDVIPLDLDWTRSTQITRTGTRYRRGGGGRRRAKDHRFAEVDRLVCAPDDEPDISSRHWLRADKLVDYRLVGFSRKRALRKALCRHCRTECGGLETLGGRERIITHHNLHATGCRDGTLFRSGNGHSGDLVL